MQSYWRCHALIVSFISGSASKCQSNSSPDPTCSRSVRRMAISTRGCCCMWHRVDFRDRVINAFVLIITRHTIILNRKVITLRMHVVNLILFENHMSELSVFAQHNSSASLTTARTHRSESRCHVLIPNRRAYVTVSMFDCSMARNTRTSKRIMKIFFPLQC